MRLDEQPVGLGLAGTAAHADQVPGAPELLAVEREGQMTLLEALMRIAVRLPDPPIPDHDRAAAVFALRDRALEFVVLDRVILDLDREALLARNKARAAGDGPALHDAVELEPKVVMQPARGMLLNDEPV